MFGVIFLSLLIIAALSWGLELLCARAVFLSLAPAATERKNVALAARRTAPVLPVCLALDFVAACVQGNLYASGILSSLLLVIAIPIVAYFSLRRYAHFTRARSFGAAVLLDALNVLLLTGGICF